MKKRKLIPMLTLLIAMMFVVSCKDEEPAPLVKITGKITYKDPTGTTANAAGAVVYLATSAVVTTTYEQSTIADADGVYSFSGLGANTYFVNSVYKTDNKNIKARLDGMTFTTVEGAIVTVADVDVTQDMTLVSIGQSGSTFEALAVNYAWDPNATPSATFKNTGAWTYDATHSPIFFEFPYRDHVADFGGALSQASKFIVNFDAANLATSSIDVEMDMASINTRAPGGRDPAMTATTVTFTRNTQFTTLGCILGTSLGIPGDGGVPSVSVPQPITAVGRYAQFKSTSIEKYGDGFVAKGNLTFHGFTVPVNLLFKQSPVWVDASNANRKYSGFEGKFTMALKKDYGVTSSSVNDAVLKIQVSIVVYK